MEQIRFGRLKILTDCSHCGAPVKINGPLRRVLCTSCHKELSFSEKLWNNLLRQLDQFISSHPPPAKNSFTLTTGADSYKVSMGSGAPTCAHCHEQLDLSSSDAFTGETRCPACSETTSFEEAPSWLSEHRSMKIIGGESETASYSPQTRASAPITMNCPNCSGALKITDSLKRVTTCDYCGTEFFIPDAVWNRLHPVEVAREWSVRFEGTPKWLIEKEQAAEARRQSKAREERERTHRKAVEKLSAKINALELGGPSKYGWGYFVALMAGIFAIGFPIIFIPPLSRVVGERICDGEYQRRTYSSGGKTSIKFYCRKGASVESIDGQMFLFGPGAGVLLLGGLWTLCIPLLKLKARKRINLLKEQLEKLKQTGPPLH